TPEANGQQAAPPAVQIPPLLPVLALRDGIIYPMSVAPVVVQDEHAVRAGEDSMRTHRLLCVVARREGGEEVTQPRAALWGGGAAQSHESQRGPDGAVRIVLQGLERLHIERFVQTDPYLIAATEKTPDRPSSGDETEAMVRRLRTQFHDLAEIGRAVPQQVVS